MSKKTSNLASVPHAEQGPPPEFIRKLIAEQQMNRAIEQTMHWFSKCPGPCFPLVFRGWDS